MVQPARHPGVRHRLLAALVLAHILAVVALAASPRLHHWVHPDADDDDHDCAAVLFLHGGCHQAPLPAPVPVCADTWQSVPPAACQPIRVASVFASNGVLEHAPPPVGRLPIALFLLLA